MPSEPTCPRRGTTDRRPLTPHFFAGFGPATPVARFYLAKISTAGEKRRYAGLCRPLPTLHGARRCGRRNFRGWAVVRLQPDASALAPGRKGDRPFNCPRSQWRAAGVAPIVPNFQFDISPERLNQCPNEPMLTCSRSCPKTNAPNDSGPQSSASNCGRIVRSPRTETDRARTSALPRRPRRARGTTESHRDRRARRTHADGNCRGNQLHSAT